MKRIYFIIILFLFSCSNRENEKLSVVKELTRFEKLMMLPNDSVLAYYDLSGDSLKEIPDLSSYTILSLNLSHNQIDTVVAKNLPKKLEILNLAHNDFSGYIQIEENSISDLREIDLSYNKLTEVNIRESLYRAILSHNDITVLHLYQPNVRYLDISYNPNFSNRTTSFLPDGIDTIVRKGIANNRRMYHPRGPWGVKFFSERGLAERYMKERDEKFAKIYSDSVEYRTIVRIKRGNNTLNISE